MECPNCKSTQIKVLNSKKKDYKTFNIRVVECDVCSTVFQTIESVLDGSVSTAVSKIVKPQTPGGNSNSKKGD